MGIYEESINETCFNRYEVRCRQDNHVFTQNESPRLHACALFGKMSMVEVTCSTSVLESQRQLSHRRPALTFSCVSAHLWEPPMQCPPRRSEAQGELSAWGPHCPRKDGSSDAGDVSQIRSRLLGSHARRREALGHQIVNKYSTWNKLTICGFMGINKKRKLFLITKSQLIIL